MLYKSKYLLLVFLFLSMLSCEDDFLDRKPTDAISDIDALGSVENLQLILNGMHRGLYSQSQTVFPGGNTGRANDHYWVPLGDNLAGYLIHSANANNLAWRSAAQWNEHTLPTSLTIRLLWYHRYNIILHANLIINRIAEGEFLDSDQLNEILGQAYTYRAHAYLSLIQHYAKGYLIGDPTTDPGVSYCIFNRRTI